jgi:hypothetical protein
MGGKQAVLNKIAQSAELDRMRTGAFQQQAAQQARQQLLRTGAKLVKPAGYGLLSYEPLKKLGFLPGEQRQKS